jgi:hypothetical protein
VITSSLPLVFSSLVFLFQKLKLELSELLLYLRVCLLDGEQTFHNLCFGQLQVPRSGATHVMVLVNAQRLCLSHLPLSFP